MKKGYKYIQNIYFFVVVLIRIITVIKIPDYNDILYADSISI